MSESKKMGIREKMRREYKHIDSTMILDFFIIFSRFEYALKSSGYIPDKKKSKPEIDWKNFKEEIKDEFKLEEVKHPNEMELFEDFKTQYIYKGTLKWREFNIDSTKSDAEIIIDIVKTIRNNLFHGAKNTEYCTGVDEKRDENLLLYGIKAIEKLIEAEKEVKTNFYYTLP